MKRSVWAQWYCTRACGRPRLAESEGVTLRRDLMSVESENTGTTSELSAVSKGMGSDAVDRQRFDAAVDRHMRRSTWGEDREAGVGEWRVE